MVQQRRRQGLRVVVSGGLKDRVNACWMARLARDGDPELTKEQVVLSLLEAGLDAVASSAAATPPAAKK